MEGLKITREKLEQNGWEDKKDNFGSCRIFGKANDRILWNPKSQIVESEYQFK